MSYKIVRVDRKPKATVNILTLKAGQAFARGYHDLEGILHGQPFSIYIKLPRSNRSLGQLDPEHTDAAKEGRAALNLNKGSCVLIPANEDVWPLDLSIHVEVLA